MAVTPSGDPNAPSGGPNKGKSLEDYADKMGVTVEQLKNGMQKYGLDRNDLMSVQKRQVLAAAIENKWTKDEFRGNYDRAVPEAQDYDFETIVRKYGYSLGVLKEFKKDLNPIFKWLARQLQKGETLDNLQAEFERRLNQTDFGRRPSTELKADIARYGTQRQDFRKTLGELRRRIREVAAQSFGQSILDDIDEGVTQQLALDLIYQDAGFLDGNYDSFNVSAIKRRLKVYQEQNIKPAPVTDIGLADGATGDATGDMAAGGADDLTGEWGSNRAALMQWLSRNGVVLDESRMNEYLWALDNETMDLNTIKQDVRNRNFTTRYAAYADLFKQGTDVSDIAMDFRQTAANLLEKSVDSITIDDPMIQQALQYKGADGKPATMALYEFEQKVRKSPEWDKTDNAMAAYTDVGETILRNFGFRG